MDDLEFEKIRKKLEEDKAEDKQRLELAVQSYFTVTKLKDPFYVQRFAPNRPAIQETVGSAIATLSRTEEGSSYIDIGSTDQEFLNELRTALEDGAEIQTWDLSAVSKERQLEIAEIERDNLLRAIENKKRELGAKIHGNVSLAEIAYINSQRRRNALQKA
jgi:hypothetical protein